MSSKFLWLDLETTGLVPGAGRILELAIASVDDEDPEMPELLATSVVLGYPGIDWSTFAIDPYVQRMHSDNGLWADVAASDVSLAEVEEWLLSQFPQRGIVLAGSSVHFDLGWIRCHMPRFAARLSHRIFDISTIVAMARTWYGYEPVEGPAAHRALADIRVSIDRARRIRAALGRTP